METHQQPLIDTLIAQNATLSGRISQLESENTSLRIQHAGFERYFNEHRRDIYRRNRIALYGVLGEEPSSHMGDILTRREAFLRLVSEIPGCNSLLGLHPHNGMGKRFRVLLLSAGGMGDCLILTYLAALVRSYLPVDYLAVGFESKQVTDIFTDTGLANAAISLTHETRDALFSVTTALDIFDIVIDVRYSAVAFFPPQSRVPAEYQQMVRSFSEPWFKYNLFDWPHMNHNFAKVAIESKLTAYSLFPHSLALGDVAMKPVMDIEPVSSSAIDKLLAFKKPIVCLGIGSDAKMSGDKGLSTKTIPMATVEAATVLLNELGYCTVQLGMTHEPVITNATVDLRGVLAIRESAAILKLAVCFVGVEGGLVHMAKAVGTPSVVCFGPTPAKFFGYEDNINISNNQCTPCWWTTREWMTRCVSTTAQLGCTKMIEAKELVDGVKALHTRHLRPIEIILMSAGEFSPASTLVEPIPSMADIYPDVISDIQTDGLVNCYIDRHEKHGVIVLKRNNVPHRLTINENVFVDSRHISAMALKSLNITNILDCNHQNSICVAAVDNDQINALDALDAEAARLALAAAFTAKGYTVNTAKLKKAASGTHYFVIVRWALV